MAEFKAGSTGSEVVGGLGDRVPQDAGWGAPVPLDYDALAATPANIQTLREEGKLEFAWASNAAKYEWNDEYGDVGPADTMLEEELFNDENKISLGDFINNLTQLHVNVEGPNQVKPINDFENAGLHPVALENVKKSNYVFPTPIQAYTIPAVLTGKDIVGIAQTGSGKTAAYLIPILSKLMGKAKKLAAPRPNPATYAERQDSMQAQPLVLIIVPTRELALQIFDEARRMCYRTMLRPCVVYGGGPRRAQIDDLKKGCDVLVGTTGRLKDLVMNEATWLSLKRLKFTVIDEADEMVQSDWEEELGPILSGGAASENADHAYLLFSATFPKGSRALARKYLAESHIRIRVGRIGSAHINVHQVAVWVDEENKKRCLEDLLVSLPPCRTLVFCNHVRTVEMIDDHLYNKSFPVTSLHSKRTQREREDAIRTFKNGACPIMVASAVSSRGLDIKGVMHVINYDLPSVEHGGIDEYVHRIGRTGRIGNRGQATSMFNERNQDIAEALAKIFLECNQDPPPFLQEYVPVDGKIQWNDSSEDEDKKSEKGEETGGWVAQAVDSKNTQEDLGWSGDNGAWKGDGSSWKQADGTKEETSASRVSHESEY